MPETKNTKKSLTGTFGKVLIAALSGAAAGYLIYLWRGNALAPWLCAVASASLAYSRIRGGLFRSRSGNTSGNQDADEHS